MKKILVVAAHPDDELLGIGGIVARHSAVGDQVYAIILGQGALSRKGSKNTEVARLRRQASQAGSIVGYKKIFFAGFPDNAFDSVNFLEIVREVEKYLKKIKPERVYTHHEFDLNVDHRLTFQSTLTACRPCNEDVPRELFTFETLSSTEWQSKAGQQFQPNWYEDIEAVVEKKIAALRCYTTELRSYPHPRSLEGVRILARYRGLESGLKYAEALTLVRKIEA